MKIKEIIVITVCLSVLSFMSCSKRMPKSFGQFEGHYSCLGMFPFGNETSFAPMDDLLTGYLSLALYKAGFQDILSSKDSTKIFKDEGKVYFPRRFNKNLAIEYATLLGLDGVFYGEISSPELAGSDISGNPKLFNIALYFLDSKKADIVWSYSERSLIKPGNYNDEIKDLSKRVTKSLSNSGLRYVSAAMPCWDTVLASKLKALPSISREMFNTLSADVSQASEGELWLNLGNVFMTIGKRSLALTQFKKYLVRNPNSPFRDEVERQVAVIEGTP